MQYLIERLAPSIPYSTAVLGHLFAIDQTTVGCLLNFRSDGTPSRPSPIIARLSTETGNVSDYFESPFLDATRCKYFNGSFYFLAKSPDGYHIIDESAGTKVKLDIASTPTGPDDGVFEFEVNTFGYLYILIYNLAGSINCIDKHGSFRWNISLESLFPDESFRVWEHNLIIQPDHTFVLFAGCEFDSEIPNQDYFYLFLHFDESGQILSKKRIFNGTTTSNWIGANYGTGVILCGDELIVCPFYDRVAKKWACVLKDLSVSCDTSEPTTLSYDYSSTENTPVFGAAVCDTFIIAGMSRLGIIKISCSF